jgi:hypothetical protein
VFREVRYGLWFYVAAMVGAGFGVVAAWPILLAIVLTGILNNANSFWPITILAIGGFSGAIGGSAAWLVFKYRCLIPRKS